MAEAPLLVPLPVTVEPGDVDGYTLVVVHEDKGPGPHMAQVDGVHVHVAGGNSGHRQVTRCFI